MTTIEELASYFGGFNIVAGDAILSKCLEICLRYNISAEDLFDQWIAFTASKLNGAAPTVDHLETMERKELQKSKDTPRPALNTPKQSYTISEDIDAHQSLVSSYSTTPKSNRLQTSLKNSDTPKTPVAKDISSLYETTSASSPGLNASEKYSQRTDSRMVKTYFGNTTATFRRENDISISIKNHGPALRADAKYMREVMAKKANSINRMCQYVGHQILKAQGLVLSEGIWKTHIGEMTTYGRIVSDANGKINAQSILLEGSLETSAGYSTPFNINMVNKYSLFPGQVVAVKGHNVGTQFIAEKIYNNCELNLPETIPAASNPIQIVVAAGPFTLQGNLSYEPLNDILKYVKEHKPHVLILIGPFIEKTHQSILTGGLAQTFDSFFEGLIENVMNSLLGEDVQVVVVSSQKDAHHHPVYPCPPYRVRETYGNLMFVSDPCVIDIDGLIIGATSTDILFDISNFELHLDKLQKTLPDRIGRLASHVLAQATFYPVFPPPKGMLIDHEMLEQYGVLDVKPHMLILPSNLRHFVKNIQDCLVINPERATKGYVAGTFARIKISPGSSKSICNRSSCQVLNV